jgi:hypothetical protein
VNGKSIALRAKPLSHAVIDREWKHGDSVTLRLPMRVTVRRWAKNHNAASVNYGPLTFSLKIDEQWTRYGGTDAWPEWEVRPKTAWNYGLVLNESDPANSIEILKNRQPLAPNPFLVGESPESQEVAHVHRPQTSPIALRVKAKKIPAWKIDRFGLVGKLQDSPVKSEGPAETVMLIPMGAARLRLSTFPVIGIGPKAHEWTEQKPPPVSASHCFERDSVEAMIDGLEPKNSNDHSIPRFTWWDHRGTIEWAQYDFDKPRRISGVEVYWFDDAPNGGCRAPRSWTLLYKNGDAWKPVDGASEFGAKLNVYNRVTFNPVETTALRMEAQLQPNFSGGILEWKIQP